MPRGRVLWIMAMALGVCFGKGVCRNRGLDGMGNSEAHVSLGRDDLW